MRIPIIATALIMAAIPAAAQQSGSQQPQSKNAVQTESPSNAQAKLRKSLDQAGFKDINVVDATYLVHARTADGHFAVMYIDPPAATTGSGKADKSGADGQQAAAMTRTKVRQSLEKAGFEDVKIVDAAYVVRAKTSEGSAAVMSINPASTMPDQTSATNASPGTQQAK